MLDVSLKPGEMLSIAFHWHATEVWAYPWDGWCGAFGWSSGHLPIPSPPSVQCRCLWRSTVDDNEAAELMAGPEKKTPRKWRQVKRRRRNLQDTREINGLVNSMEYSHVAAATTKHNSNYKQGEFIIRSIVIWLVQNVKCVHQVIMMIHILEIVI